VKVWEIVLVVNTNGNKRCGGHCAIQRSAILVHDLKYYTSKRTWHSASQKPFNAYV
jgi:hypothetical protein